MSLGGASKKVRDAACLSPCLRPLRFSSVVIFTVGP